MPFATVNGLKIAYELHGEGEPVAITVGGRFSMDDARGYRGLAEALAAGGKQALIWDRPNTGRSDLNFEADFESDMHADTLAGLIETLELGPTAIMGGSAGSRVSLLTVIRHPEIASRLAIWWITGGFFGLLGLANHYAGESWQAVMQGGMEAVAAMPHWQETLTVNPDNRDRMLAMDPEWFAARMEAWGPTFLPYPDSPVPGIHREDFATIKVPTLVFRSGASDRAHPRKTSEEVHALIPHSRLAEPPWPDTEWNDASALTREQGINVRFGSWPKLAPQLLEFMNEPVPAVT
jgi:pimeloyl-ACP methyl ester carboxylesterase